jgi:acetyl/propionyl-CoA carboxylase alpha subunit
MSFTYEHRGQIHTVELQSSAAGYIVLVDGVPVEVASGATVAKNGRDIYVHYDGRSYVLKRVAGQAGAAGSGGGSGVLRAPMPGQVRQVLVSDGQQVAAGETLVILEAMKMEMRIQAPQATKVARVAVSQGQSVEREQTLVELESDVG